MSSERTAFRASAVEAPSIPGSPLGQKSDDAYTCHERIVFPGEVLLSSPPAKADSDANGILKSHTETNENFSTPPSESSKHGFLRSALKNSPACTSEFKFVGYKGYKSHDELLSSPGNIGSSVKKSISYNTFSNEKRKSIEIASHRGREDTYRSSRHSEVWDSKKWYRKCLDEPKKFVNSWFDDHTKTDDVLGVPFLFYFDNNSSDKTQADRRALRAARRRNVDKKKSSDSLAGSSVSSSYKLRDRDREPASSSACNSRELSQDLTRQFSYSNTIVESFRSYNNIVEKYDPRTTRYTSKQYFTAKSLFLVALLNRYLAVFAYGGKMVHNVVLWGWDQGFNMWYLTLLNVYVGFISFILLSIHGTYMWRWQYSGSTKKPLEDANETPVKKKKKPYFSFCFQQTTLFFKNCMLTVTPVVFVVWWFAAYIENGESLKESGLWPDPENDYLKAKSSHYNDLSFSLVEANKGTINRKRVCIERDLERSVMPLNNYDSREHIDGEIRYKTHLGIQHSLMIHGYIIICPLIEFATVQHPYTIFGVPILAAYFFLFAVLNWIGSMLRSYAFYSFILNYASRIDQVRSVVIKIAFYNFSFSLKNV